MIKGLIALFTTGAIFNPMVLLGIAMAVFSLAKLDEEQIKALLLNWHLYAAAGVVSFVFAFLFKKTYQDDGITIDYAALIFNTLWGVVKFVLAWLLTISLVVLISF